MTYRELTNLKRKQSRQTTKEIESILHPCPNINGYDILHEHLASGYIRFSAWKDNRHVDNRYVEFHRNELVGWTNFYQDQASNFSWVITGNIA